MSELTELLGFTAPKHRTMLSSDRHATVGTVTAGTLLPRFELLLTDLTVAIRTGKTNKRERYGKAEAQP
jgi:hypothetical protein